MPCSNLKTFKNYLKSKLILKMKASSSDYLFFKTGRLARLASFKNDALCAVYVLVKKVKQSKHI